jgi:L-lactate dehydrogenase complex protein LldF
VCPVKIDIPTVLLHLRAEVVRRAGSRTERLTMRALAWIFGGPRRFALAQRLGRIAQRSHVRVGPLAKWTKTRDLPPPPRESFREWWSRERA